MDTKVKTWRYVVKPCVEGELEPNDRGQWWGIFLLDGNGMMACNTDAGDYVYNWGPHFGDKDFRQFLLQLSVKYPDYLLGKISRDDEYDEVETLRNVKQELFRRRRKGDLTKEKARQHYLNIARYNHLFQKSDVDEWYYSGDANWVDLSDVYCTKYPCQAEYFVSKVFSRLKPLLAADLKAEGLSIPPVKWHEDETQCT